MTTIQSRRRSVVPQVQEILLPAGREKGGEVRRRAVVNVVAPGVGADELQTASEPAGHLRRKSVVKRIPDRRPPCDCGKESQWAKDRIALRRRTVPSGAS